MFCLDTNIIIYAMNERRPNISKRLDLELAKGTKLFVPSIVLFKLNYGIAKSNRAEKTALLLKQFFAAEFEFPAFSSDDANHAADIRAYLESRGTPIGAYDILIAAQARRLGAVLVTENRREFERVPSLMVTDWAN
jgi:tRNA(fMet)-specific endonuclease VapC